MGSDDVFLITKLLCWLLRGYLFPDNIYYGNVILKTSHKLYPTSIKSAYQLCFKQFFVTKLYFIHVQFINTIFMM